MNNPRIMDEPDLIDKKKQANQIIYDAKTCHITSIEQVDLKNLRIFLINILQSYMNKFISDNKLLDILDYTDIYIHRRYMDDYPDTCYPSFSLNDARSIGLDAINYIEEAMCRTNLPYDIAEKIIIYLQTPLGQEEHAHKQIADYLINKKAIRRKYYE